MKGAVLIETNKDLSILDLEVPELKSGQVLVEIAYSGLCRSQLMEIKGGRGEDKYLPHLLGHEASGKVVKISDGVRKVKEGDWVILTWIKGSGMEVPSCQYRSCDGNLINSGAVTCLSQFSVVSENRCIVKPKNLRPDIAILFGCALPTGMGMVLNEIKPEPGSTIAVFGLGGIGMASLVALTLLDDINIIAVDTNLKKLDLAKKLGCLNLIDASKDDVLSEIRALTNGKGVDYAIEASGSTRVIEQAFLSVRDRGGQCIFASHPPNGQKIEIEPHDLIRGKSIRGSWGGACNPDVDVPHFAELCIKNNVPLEMFLSAPYMLSEINLAVNDLEEAKILRALIKINADL